MCKFIFLRGGSMICDLKSNSLKIFDLIYCCSCPHPSVLSNKLNQWWSGQPPAGSLLPAACKCVQSEASLKPLELNHYINPVCQFRDNLSCCCLSFTPAACVEDTAWTRPTAKTKSVFVKFLTLCWSGKRSAGASSNVRLCQLSQLMLANVTYRSLQ